MMTWLPLSVNFVSIVCSMQWDIAGCCVNVDVMY